MSFGPINEKLLAFYYLETFADNILSIDSNDMNILRLDASGYGDSNEP
jgi:hypothetical protein